MFSSIPSISITGSNSFSSGNAAYSTTSIEDAVLVGAVVSASYAETTGHVESLSSGSAYIRFENQNIIGYTTTTVQLSGQETRLDGDTVALHGYDNISLNGYGDGDITIQQFAGGGIEIVADTINLTGLTNISNALITGTISNAVSASYAPGNPSISASYALTASYSMNGGGSSGNSNFSISSSWASSSLSASYAPFTQVYQTNTISSSWASSSLSSSYATLAKSASYYPAQTYQANTTSASWASSSLSSSYATLARTASFATSYDSSSIVTYINNKTVVSSSYSLSSSLADKSLWSDNTSTAVYAFSSTSASYSLTASYAPSSPSVSASYALTSSYALNGGSSGTSNKTIQSFYPGDSNYVASAYAQFNTINGVAVLDFDGVTAETASWIKVLPQGAVTSSGFDLNIKFTSAATSSATVTSWIVWKAQFDTLESGSSVITASTFGPVVTVSQSLAIPSYIPRTAILPFPNNFDGITPQGLYRLVIMRDPADVSDNVASDARLLSAELEQLA